jgi:hypothetical protein
MICFNRKLFFLLMQIVESVIIPDIVTSHYTKGNAMWKRFKLGDHLSEDAQYLTCYLRLDGSYSHPIKSVWLQDYECFFFQGVPIIATIYLEIPEPKIEEL